jgi:CDP-diglyceride synthetase
MFWIHACNRENVSLLFDSMLLSNFIYYITLSYIFDDQLLILLLLGFWSFSRLSSRNGILKKFWWGIFVNGNCLLLSTYSINMIFLFFLFVVTHTQLSKSNRQKNFFNLLPTNLYVWYSYNWVYHNGSLKRLDGAKDIVYNIHSDDEAMMQSNRTRYPNICLPEAS